MSSPEFKIDNPYFIDPETGRVTTYGKFLADLAAPARPEASANGAQKTLNRYSTICQLISNIIQGNDCRLNEGRVETIAENLKSEISHSKDWLQKIRDSESRIQLKTSGTTGQPKHVVHSVESLTRGVRTGAHHQDDVWGLAYPLDHLAGLQVLFQALFNQNTIVGLFGLPIETVHQAIEKYGITHLSCTPTFLKLLATDAHSHVAVKRLTTGGERSDSATLSAVKQLFPNARHRNIYALTEVGNLLVANGDQFTVPLELQKQVTVIDGCLAIHRTLLADPTIDLVGNQDSPESRPAKPNPTMHNDWFLTGDLVDIINEHPLTFKFLARRDDVINVGGYKVVPQQVEECLVKLSEVQQAVVYGRKNSVTGQIVACDVVLKAGLQLDPAAAKQQLAEELPRYAVPRIFNIVESLPMTPSGKLCRRDETS